MGTCTSLGNLAPNQSIRDGETLVSQSGAFEAGFFSPGSSKVIWVPNRETPVQNNSGVLKRNEKGILVILNGNNSTVWSASVSSKEVSNPIPQLLDSGNLVVKNGHDSIENHFLWQSFDYPVDSLLPKMKLGWNLDTGLERSVTSWNSEDDPAKGEYSIEFDHRRV
ncbi:G-type lectin S-receptor serine/threonine-protein kinase [Spatholobus suberectus]|nr:G-type lectin S-receptor serine/threonine-protein kinase [Spatholobus suberectus]